MQLSLSTPTYVKGRPNEKAREVFLIIRKLITTRYQLTGARIRLAPQCS